MYAACVGLSSVLPSFAGRLFVGISGIDEQSSGPGDAGSTSMTASLPGPPSTTFLKGPECHTEGACTAARSVIPSHVPEGTVEVQGLCQSDFLEREHGLVVEEGGGGE